MVGLDEKLGETEILVSPLAILSVTAVTVINSLPLIKFSIDVTLAPINFVYLAT